MNTLPTLFPEELASDCEDSLPPANENPQDDGCEPEQPATEETDNEPIVLGLVASGLVDPPKTFTSLRDALRHVVGVLIPKRHRYIVNVCGPDQMVAAQFVPEVDVVHNGRFGLALYLAFDGGSGESPHHVRFKNCPASAGFRSVPFGGVPCYAVCFGTDVEAAARTLWTVASSVFYNADSMELEIVVHDEGRRQPI